MAPWNSGAAASMRQASMATSCVAEENATRSASAAICARSTDGSVRDIPSRPMPMPIIASSIHERRRPSRRVSTGSGSRSTTGAHNTLME